MEVGESLTHVYRGIDNRLKTVERWLTEDPRRFPVMLMLAISAFMLKDWGEVGIGTSTPLLGLAVSLYDGEIKRALGQFNVFSKGKN